MLFWGGLIIINNKQLEPMRERDITPNNQMKTILKVMMCASLCTFTFTNCAAKKPVAKQEQPQIVAPQKSAEELELEALQQQREINRLKKQMELDDAQMNAELEAAKLKAQNARKAISKRMGQDLYTPCIDEAYDKAGEYMAGLGIAENEIDRGAAKTNANRYAIADISSRYIGAIKNGVSQYAKNVNTRNGAKVKESELEGLAESIGQKTIDKYANNVCTTFEQADDGTYTCYVAIQVPLKEVIDDTIDELGVIQTDLDRQKMRQYMSGELEQQAAAKAQEKKDLEDMRQMLE